MSQTLNMDTKASLYSIKTD